MTSSDRGIIAGLSVALVALLAGGIWFYRTQESQLRRRVENEMVAVAQLKVAEIVEWRTHQLEEAGELLARPLLRSRIVAWLTDRSGNRDDLEAEFRGLQKFAAYQDVLLVDPQGRAVLSLTGGEAGLHPEAAAALARCARERGPVLTELHAGKDYDYPHLGVVAPIFAGDRLLGAILMVCNAREFLYPLIQNWPTPSRSAEALLVRRDGNDILFLNDLRHRPDAALKFRLPANQPGLPAAMVMRGREGVVEGRDYRGVAVLAAVQRIPDSTWSLVSKIDTAEAMAEWRTRSALILALLAVTVAVMAAGGLLFWQSGRRAHFQALYDAQAARRLADERHGATLKSIGDGVIAADPQGRVVLLNPVAETLTGWTNDEARGRPLAEVFRIISEETRHPLADAAERVLREGAVVGLANHTLLVARDGVERPIADSGAPIRDETGQVTGVVLVFRDRTEERAAQKALRDSESLHHSTVTALSEGILVFNPAGRILSCNPAAEHILGLTRAEMVEFRGELAAWSSLRADGSPFPAEETPAAQTLATGEPRRGVEMGSITPHGGLKWLLVNSEPMVDPATGKVVAAVVSFTDVTARNAAAAERAKLQNDLVQAQKMESVGQLAGGVAHDFNNMLGVILGHTELALAATASAEPIREHLEAIQVAAERSADLTRQLLAFARKQTVAPKIMDLNAAIPGTLRMLRRLIGEDIDLAWRPADMLWPVLIDPAQVDQVLANLAVNARDAIAGVGKITIETRNADFDEAYCARHAGFAPGQFVMLAVSDDGSGMERDTLDHLFEPFFTTKKLGRGTGLGLAMVYGIVKQNGGFINVYSEPGKGTTLRIYLARTQGEVAAAGPAPVAVAPPAQGEVVLLVEDEPTLLDLSRAMLEGLGYTVLVTNRPGRAIQLAESYPGDINLLVTDVVMPELNGRALANRLRQLKPGMKYLFMSGYTASAIAHRGVLDEGVHFLQKPFSLHDLAVKVREALEVS